MRRWIPHILTAVALSVMPLPVSALPDSSGVPAAALSAAGWQGTLRPGDRGEQVAVLQTMLADAGFDPGPVDGIYGPLTQGAVRRAQGTLALKVDGLAGRSTQEALRMAAPGPLGGAAEASPVSKLVLHGAATDASTESDPEAAFAVTFNGEPDSTLLPRVLDALKRHGMVATFFLHGETALIQPELVARIAAAGHEVGNSGMSGADLTRLPALVARSGIRQAQNALTRAAGRAPAYFRPPAGRFNRTLVQTAESAGLVTVLWNNAALLEEAGFTAEVLGARLADYVAPGAVIMLHQDRPDSVDALDTLLQSARSRGYTSVGLSNLGTSQP